MSCIDTDGRSSRLRSRAQNLAMTSESAPRSVKKWLSAGTCSARITSASTSASASASPVWVSAAGPAVMVSAEYPIALLPDHDGASW